MREQLLPVVPDGVAPDGSVFRHLLVGARGQLCHFELPAGAVSRPVVHRQVEELWYVLAGSGELWRRSGQRQRIVHLEPGLCADIAPGTAFQFRADDDGPLQLLIATLPPWPGDEEAQPCDGVWDCD